MRSFLVGQTRALDEGSAWSVEVPVDCAYFEGHFPGAPVLPAVAQLALIEELAGRVLGARVALRGLTAMRFRAPIRGAGRVDVRLQRAGEQDGETLLDCELSQGGKAVARGRVRVAAASD